MRSVAARSAGVRSAKPRGARALILSALDMVSYSSRWIGKTCCGPTPCGGEGQGRVAPSCHPRRAEGAGRGSIALSVRVDSLPLRYAPAGNDTLLVIPGLVPGIHVFKPLKRGWPGQARP